MIKDNGDRTAFSSGAVRDIQTDKGRCDLLPLSVACSWISSGDMTLDHIDRFIETGEVKWLYEAMTCFVTFNLNQAGKRESKSNRKQRYEALLDVSIQYKEGAQKYGERNWEKGIPLHSYIDSGVRHYLKHRAGRIDEKHDRAFLWNMMGAIWTVKHKRGLCDLPVFDVKEEPERSLERTMKAITEGFGK